MRGYRWLELMSVKGFGFRDLSATLGVLESCACCFWSSAEDR